MGSFFRLWVRFGFGIGCGPGLLRVGRTMAPPLRGLPGSLPFGAPAHPFPLPLPGSPLLPLLRAALNPPVRPPALPTPKGHFLAGSDGRPGPMPVPCAGGSWWSRRHRSRPGMEKAIGLFTLQSCSITQSRPPLRLWSALLRARRYDALFQLFT